MRLNKWLNKGKELSFGLLVMVVIVTIIGLLGIFLDSSREAEQIFISILYVFGSWAIVAAAYHLGRYVANGVMKDQVYDGKARGTMSRSERILLGIECLAKTFGIAAIPAMFWLVTESNKGFFHRLPVALAVITIPALYGINGEIKRWLKGLKKLTAADPDMDSSVIAGKMDGFQHLHSSTDSEW